jgi:hypothetical protein
MLQGLFAVALALVNAGADVNYHHNQETPLGNLVHWLNGMVGAFSCSHSV